MNVVTERKLSVEKETKISLIIVEVFLKILDLIEGDYNSLLS